MYAELCNSGEYQNLPQRKLTEILRGREVSKGKNFKGKFEFQGVGGFKQNHFLWEGYGQFLEQHILNIDLLY